MLPQQYLNYKTEYWRFSAQYGDETLHQIVADLPNTLCAKGNRDETGSFIDATFVSVKAWTQRLG